MATTSPSRTMPGDLRGPVVVAVVVLGGPDACDRADELSRRNVCCVERSAPPLASKARPDEEIQSSVSPPARPSVALPPRRTGLRQDRSGFTVEEPDRPTFVA